MTRTVTGSDAVQAASRTKYTHGLLLPIEATYYKWADNQLDTEGRPIKLPSGKNAKVDGTGGERDYEQWVKLPESGRGQKWTFKVDPRVIKPDLQFTVDRGVMLGFEEWNVKTAPSIMDTVGQGEKSVAVFLDRGAAGGWYTESEMVFTGFYQDKPQDTHKFLRMTQDLDELKSWNLERYPKAVLVIPEELVERGRLVMSKMAKGNPDKFNTLISGDEDLSPYLVQFAANDYQLVR